MGNGLKRLCASWPWKRILIAYTNSNRCSLTKVSIPIIFLHVAVMKEKDEYRSRGRLGIEKKNEGEEDLLINLRFLCG